MGVESGRIWKSCVFETVKVVGTASGVDVSEAKR
jgi:hypothetical protein